MGLDELLLHLAEEKGIEKGITLKQKEFTIKLISSTEFGDDKIADLVGVSLADAKQIRNELL